MPSAKNNNPLPVLILALGGILFVSAAVLFFVTMPATESPSPSNTQAAPIATRNPYVVLMGSYALVVNSWERSQGYDIFRKPKPGNVFISVDVTIESLGERVLVNPLYANLVDGNSYSYTINIAGKEPILRSQNDLPLHQSMRGWLTFEVPAGASGFVFQYRLGFSGERISIVL